MGLEFSLKVVARIVDLFVWPLFAMAYPLCVTIWAIESNATRVILKLARYWVLFSLFLLFELLFVKLLEWLPFWPYVKLGAICWLVIPYFNGASYAYERLVRECHAINVKFLNNWFIKRKDKVLVEKPNNLMVVAKNCIKESESEALEKLILGKVHGAASDHPLVNGSIPTKSRTELQSKQGSTSSELPNSSSKKVQKEWICALCLVTVNSEITMKHHLKGQRHWEKMKEMKEKLKAVKNKVALPSTTKKAITEASGSNHNSKQKTNKTTFAGTKLSDLWCAECEIQCSGIRSMIDHRNGKRHLNRLKQQ